jgi:hypothetical protein
MTDRNFRALCAELAEELDHYYIGIQGHDRSHSLAAKARAALTKPEPQEPTDEDLWELYDDMGGDPEDCAWCKNYARAVLSRWGS